MKIQRISSINYQNSYVSKNSIKPNTTVVQNSNSSISFGSLHWFWQKKEKPVINSESECFCPLRNARNLTPRILCGGLGNMIYIYDYLGNRDIFSQLKKSGKIDTVIYLGESAGVTEEMQKSMKKAGVKYFNLSMWGVDNWFVKNGCKTSISSEYYEKLKTFLQILNPKNNVLMGCAQGMQRTSRALVLNYFLNKERPSGEQTLKCCLNVGDYTMLENFKKTKQVFDALSKQQKAELGIADRKLPEIDMTDVDGAIMMLKKEIMSEAVSRSALLN